MRKRCLKCLCFAICFFHASNVFAQDNLNSEDELQQLLKLLAEQTSLATQTRMNADYVPGMVSVLTFEELLSRGFSTVWDALATVPGVLLSINSTGMRSISVRGIGDIFEPGKVKLLLNGKSLNISASSTTGAIFDIPVQQIERIEFIRGPGSAVHGEFAFAGVLNVITRKDHELYSVGIGSDESFQVSGLKSFELGGDLTANFNFAFSDSVGEDIDVDADRSSASIPSYAPGRLNNKRDFTSFIFDIESDEFNAGIQFQQVNRGDFFGINNLLPPDEKQTVISDTVLSVYVGQNIDLYQNLELEWSLNGLQNSLERNELFLGRAEAFGGLASDSDVVADTLVEENRFDAKLSLRYSSDWHEIFSELTVSDISVGESRQFVNLDPATSLPSTTMNEFPGPVDKSLDRRAFSIAFQDQYHLNQQLTLTTGLRYDNYEDIEDSLSPRIAMVWRASDYHIFKIQLARAFRPPSLVEVSGSLEPSIDPEKNDTFEIGHIFNHQDLIVRSTFYYSDLVDLITFQDVTPFGYLNSNRYSVRGYELEIENKFRSDWQIQSSFTFQDDDTNELGSVVPWVAKLGLQYQFSALSQINSQLVSISSRERISSDSRDDFPQSTQIDIGFERKKFLGFPALSLRFGIDNVFGEEINFVASENTYRDDYLFSDSPVYSVQISYSP